MGTVTQKESDIIAAVSAKVKGVNKVVNLMTIISEEELEKRKLMSESTSNNHQNSSANIRETVEAETIPVN